MKEYRPDSFVLFRLDKKVQEKLEILDAELRKDIYLYEHLCSGGNIFEHGIEKLPNIIECVEFSYEKLVKEIEKIDFDINHMITGHTANYEAFMQYFRMSDKYTMTLVQIVENVFCKKVIENNLCEVYSKSILPDWSRGDILISKNGDIVIFDEFNIKTSRMFTATCLYATKNSSNLTGKTYTTFTPSFFALHMKKDELESKFKEMILNFRND